MGWTSFGRLAALILLLLALATQAHAQRTTPDEIPGGIYNTTTPSLTNYQQYPVQLDVGANLKVTPAIGGLSSMQTTSGTNLIVKTTGGIFYRAYATVATTTAGGYLQIYDTTTVPNDAASGKTPLDCVPVLATTAGGSIDYTPVGGIPYTTGIVAILSQSTSCAAKVTNASLIGLIKIFFK